MDRVFPILFIIFVKEHNFSMPDFLSKEDLIERTQLSNTLLKKLDDLGVLKGLDDSNQMTLF